MSVLSQESDVTIAHVSHLQSLPHAHNGEQTAGIGMVWRNCVYGHPEYIRTGAHKRLI